MHWRTRFVVFHGETLAQAVAEAGAWSVKQNSLYRKDFSTKIEGHTKPLPCSLQSSSGSWTMTIRFQELVTVEDKKAA